MTWLDIDRQPGKWDDVPETRTAQQAYDQAIAAQAPPFVPFATRAEAIATDIPLAVQCITVAGLDYIRDDAGTALTTVGGQNWSPLGSVSVGHFGAVADGVTDDVAAINAAGQFAAAKGWGKGAVVRMGPGQFKISGPIIVPDGVVFEGEGERATRIVKADANGFWWMAESEGFDADLAANGFRAADASSIGSGFVGVGFFGGKTYPGIDGTVTVASSAINVAGLFKTTINGGGTITAINGATDGQPVKLTRGDADVTVNLGGPDAINVTLTAAAPYLFLHRIGTDWRTAEAVSALAGGVRLYTRLARFDHCKVYNVLGCGVWLAGPDAGGSQAASEMPETYAGPIYIYRTSGIGFRYSGFHDGIIKSVSVGTNYYIGMALERVDGVSSGTGEILHAHVYGGAYRGLENRGPAHYGELICESNAAEGVVNAYSSGTVTGPTWIGTLQVYSNNADGLTDRQAHNSQPFLTVGKFIASAAATSVPTYAFANSAQRVIVDGINISGNANTYGIRNTGNYCQFRGILHSLGRGLTYNGGAYCKYDLTMHLCTVQIYGEGGDFLRSGFDVAFYADAGATVWGGSSPTFTQRADLGLHVRGKIGATDYRSRFKGKADISISAAGETTAVLTHGLWFTPDASEISLSLNWSGGNFNFSNNSTHAFVGPYVDAVNATSVTVAVYAPNSQASTMTVGCQIG